MTNWRRPLWSKIRVAGLGFWGAFRRPERPLDECGTDARRAASNPKGAASPFRDLDDEDHSNASGDRVRRRRRCRGRRRRRDGAVEPAPHLGRGDAWPDHRAGDAGFDGPRDPQRQGRARVSHPVGQTQRSVAHPADGDARRAARRVARGPRVPACEGLHAQGQRPATRRLRRRLPDRGAPGDC